MGLDFGISNLFFPDVGVGAGLISSTATPAGGHGVY